MQESRIGREYIADTSVSLVEVDPSSLENHRKGPNHKTNYEGEAEYDELRTQAWRSQYSHVASKSHHKDILSKLCWHDASLRQLA